MSLYQHIFSFKTQDQTTYAEKALSELALTPANVEVGERCLTFQTAYVLGLVLRIVLKYEMQPGVVWFNRQPQTWGKVPVIRRVTLGQVALTLSVFLLFCGVPLLEFLLLGSAYSNNIDSVFWGKVVVGFLPTTLGGVVSSDLIGLAKICCTPARPSRWDEADKEVWEQ